MGQVSAPQGLFPGASTLGASTPSANTTPAVTNAAGKLEAYNPATMAQTVAPPPVSNEHAFTGAGMDAKTGLPSYVTNWLAGGAKGAMPTASNVTPSAPVTASTAQAVVAPKGIGTTRKYVPPKPTTPGGIGTAVSASGTTMPAAGATVPGQTPQQKYGFNTATLDAMTPAQLSSLVNEIGMSGSIKDPMKYGVGWQDIPQVHNYLSDKLGAGLYTQTLAQGRMLMPPAGPTNNPTWWGGSNSS